MTQRKTWLMLAVPFLLFGLGACSSDGPTSPDDSSSPSSEETVLLSVAPEGGSTAVGMNTAITVEFSHPMNPGMSGSPRPSLSSPELTTSSTSAVG